MGSVNRYCEIEYKCGDVVEVVRGNFPVGQNQALKRVLKLKRERGKRIYSSSSSRTRNRIRRLVNSNFSEDSIFLTLTFKENVLDGSYARKSFANFLKRLIYKYPRFSSYLYVIEKQKRGSFHFHILFFRGVSLEYSILSDLWGLGFIKVESIRDIGNLGCYISSELSKDYQKMGIKGKRYGYSRNLNSFQKSKSSSNILRSSRNLARNVNLYTA